MKFIEIIKTIYKIILSLLIAIKDELSLFIKSNKKQILGFFLCCGFFALWIMFPNVINVIIIIFIGLLCIICIILLIWSDFEGSIKYPILSRLFAFIVTLFFILIIITIVVNLI